MEGLEAGEAAASCSTLCGVSLAQLGPQPPPAVCRASPGRRRAAIHLVYCNEHRGEFRPSLDHLEGSGAEPPAEPPDLVAPLLPSAGMTNLKVSADGPMGGEKGWKGCSPPSLQDPPCNCGLGQIVTDPPPFVAVAQQKVS